jgi:hypothetical protein
MTTIRDLRVVRGRGTACSSCGRYVPTSQPVLLLEDPATGELLGFYHRTCIAGAVRPAMERPGELDLTVVRMPGVAETN